MEPCREPLTVKAEAGLVIVEGGCGVAVTLTPDAAYVTGDHLIDEAASAIGQTKMPGYRPPIDAA